MRRRARHVIGKGWYGLWALMMALLVAGGVYTAPAAHADPSNGSMHVVVPIPSSDGKTVQGPVGANVSVSVSQATAGATFSLGWANPSDGCVNGFTAFTNGVVPITADSSGNFTATFPWPRVAGNPGALYLICASDTANPTTDVITADQSFQVLGSNAPKISLSQAPSSTHPGKVYDAGGPVQVKGTGFLPQGTTIEIFVTSNANFSPSDYVADNALQTEDGSAILTDGNGQFTAIVLIPATAITGKQFLYAVSTDAASTSQPQVLPSLVASGSIQIGPPAATPTVQPSPTPTLPPAQNGSDNTMRIVAIAGLGILSLALFIIGGILVASAAIGPRKPPSLDSGTRSQPAIRSDQGW